MVTRRARLVAWVLACASATAACGSGNTPGDTSVPDGSVTGDGEAGTDAATDVTMDAPALDAANDAVAADVASDAFAPADHEPLPQVPNQGGPTIPHPYIVTVTYADDSHRAAEEAFGRWVGGSSWLTTVGADYGVGSGSWISDVELPDAAPDTTTQAMIQAQLLQQAADGLLPTAPDGTHDNVVYMLYFPMHTTATWSSGGQSCREFLAFHGYAHNAQFGIAYAAIFDCGAFPGSGVDEIGTITSSGSHELIEAASDLNPINDPAYAFSALDDSAWLAESGENADLCSFPHEYYQQDGFNVTRVWSNAAAAAGGDPCIPTDQAAPYYNTSLTPSTDVTAHPGDTVTYQLAAWSLAPVADWQLDFKPTSPTVPTVQFSTTTMNNGGTGTLTVQIDPATPRNSYISGLVRSKHSDTDFHTWPLIVIVN